MRRAFVVQLNPQTSEDLWDGRIEHVDSGKTKHFHSLEEAVSFVEGVLSETETAELEISESDVPEDSNGDER